MSAADLSGTVLAGRAAARPAQLPSGSDPIPLGIAGFAMAAFVLSCINAGAAKQHDAVTG
ncbi:MAG TPA: GPR1/FUN34/YaaH family transporter [Streptosporangiaceae bacterium]|jgi:succinate-acetate transporter protein